jgi:hypothetical protein
MDKFSKNINVSVNKLFWIACLAFILFVLPFVIRFVKVEILDLNQDLKENFLFVMFIFIPIQGLILIMSVYVVKNIIKKWSQDKRLWLKAASLGMTLPIILFWVIMIFYLLMNSYLNS